MLTARKIYKKNKTSQQKYRYLKYQDQDVYSQKDLQFADISPPITMMINDFHAKSKLRQTRTFSVTTTIDPTYKKYSVSQHIFTKFQIKTDILLLKTIVRNKFAMYSTQQQYLESQMTTKYQTEIYNQCIKTSKIIGIWLNRIERDAFQKMLTSQEKAISLNQIQLADSLKLVVEEHQKVLMEVRETFRRFNWMICLIKYFDVIIEPLQLSPIENSILVPNKLSEMKVECLDLEDIKSVITKVSEYTNSIIKPYLNRKRCLDADVWIQGYEYTRHKVSNYYLHVTNLVLLNHVFNIMHEKTKSTISNYTVPTAYFKEYELLQERVSHLKRQTFEIIDNYDKVQKKDRIRKKLSALVPIVIKRVLKNLDTVKESNNQSNKDGDLLPSTTKNATSKDVLCMVEKLQWHLMEILQTLDKQPQYHVIERTVRQQFKLQKAKSHKAFILQNRYQSGLQHFQKHYKLQ